MDVNALRHRVARFFVRATCISCCNINNHKKYGTEIISYQLMMQILGQRQNKKISRKKISYLRPGYVPGQENKCFQSECRMAYYQYIKYNILGETNRMTLGQKCCSFINCKKNDNSGVAPTRIALIFTAEGKSNVSKIGIIDLPYAYCNMRSRCEEGAGSH